MNGTAVRLGDDIDFSSRIAGHKKPTLGVPGKANGSKAAIGAFGIVLITQNWNHRSSAIRRMGWSTIGELDGVQKITVRIIAVPYAAG